MDGVDFLAETNPPIPMVYARSFQSRPATMGGSRPRYDPEKRLLAVSALLGSESMVSNYQVRYTVREYGHDHLLQRDHARDRASGRANAHESGLCSDTSRRLNDRGPEMPCLELREESIN
jgi:hypothetical protein